MSSFQAFGYQNQNPLAVKPKMPYFGTIPSLTIGSIIIVCGRVPNGSQRFDFNLMVGSIITEQLKNFGDIAFHFNPRFDEQLVVRNSRQNNRWAAEEREPRVMPFIAGHDFEAMILMDENGYKVAVNGKHFIEFIHRIPLSCVGVFSINGSVEVDRIEFKREMRFLPPINPTFNVTTGQGMTPIFSPPLPYQHKFGDGLREGLMIYISGRLNQSPDRFAIDFLSTTLPDIAFHFNVRVRDSLVVRNSYLSGQWGEEERRTPEFPFYAGVNFDLIIRIESNRYMIAVNGQHFIEFKHRIPLQFVNGLTISGDIFIASIRFAQT